jgi:transcription antitermination factor NusG
VLPFGDPCDSWMPGHYFHKSQQIEMISQKLESRNAKVQPVRYPQKGLKMKVFEEAVIMPHRHPS